MPPYARNLVICRNDAHLSPLDPLSLVLSLRFLHHEKFSHLRNEFFFSMSSDYAAMFSFLPHLILLVHLMSLFCVPQIDHERALNLTSRGKIVKRTCLVFIRLNLKKLFSFLKQLPGKKISSTFEYFSKKFPLR